MKKSVVLLTVICILVSCYPLVRITRNNELHITKEPLKIDSSEFNFLKDSYNLRQIDAPWNDLGGLSPQYPIAFGIKQDFSDTSLFTKGCMFPFSHVLIVKKDNNYILLQTQEDIKNFYAPIENEEEARSYAILSSGNYTEYNFGIKLFYRKYVSKLNTTYVEKKDDGFEVGLFDYAHCGCGPHPYFNVIYFVGNNGEIKELKRQRIFENPLEDGLCVD